MADRGILSKAPVPDARRNAPERTGGRSVIEHSLSGEPFGSRPLTVETAGAGTGASPDRDTLDHTIAVVRACLSEHFPTCALPEVTDSSEFREDLGCDPLDVVSICLAVEDEFGLLLPPDEPEHCGTVGDPAALVEAVRGRLAA